MIQPNIQALKASCAAYSMQQLCLPMGLEDADIDAAEGAGGRHRAMQPDGLSGR